MKKIENSIRIQAPVSRVNDYVTQPEHFLEIWPSMVEVSNVQRTPDGAHSFDWLYKMAGMHFRGHSETKKLDQNRSIEVHNSGGIPSVFRWSFEGHDDTTTVKLEVEYEIPVPLLGRLGEAFLVKLNERENQTVFDNLKARLELVKAEPAQPRPSRPSEAHA